MYGLYRVLNIHTVQAIIFIRRDLVSSISQLRFAWKNGLGIHYLSKDFVFFLKTFPQKTIFWSNFSKMKSSSQTKKKVQEKERKSI